VIYWLSFNICPWNQCYSSKDNFALSLFPFLQALNCSCLKYWMYLFVIRLLLVSCDFFFSVAFVSQLNCQWTNALTFTSSLVLFNLLYGLKLSQHSLFHWEFFVVFPINSNFSLRGCESQAYSSVLLDGLKYWLFIKFLFEHALNFGIFASAIALQPRLYLFISLQYWTIVYFESIGGFERYLLWNFSSKVMLVRALGKNCGLVVERNSGNQAFDEIHWFFS